MRQNKGFSLAELLLSIAIIGIVSAMGITLAKQGTDKAYNLYYYSGYINLYNAIADIKSNGGNITAANIFSRIGSQINGNTVVTSNGIIYQVNNQSITMLIPQRRTRNNPNARAAVTLIEAGEYLIPLPPNNNAFPNLQIRRDLLPAYVDDGIVGRMRKVTNANGVDNYVMTQIPYYTYREVYCKINNNTSVQGVIDCTNVNQNVVPATGTLKIADPRKVH